MEIVLNNSDKSCTKISNIDYFIDPLSKIIAFMLSCSESSGSTAYEIIYLKDKASYHFMGKKKLMVLPQKYWDMSSAEPS